MINIPKFEVDIDKKNEVLFKKYIKYIIEKEYNNFDILLIKIRHNALFIVYKENDNNISFDDFFIASKRIDNKPVYIGYKLKKKYIMSNNLIWLLYNNITTYCIDINNIKNILLKKYNNKKIMVIEFDK